MLQDINDSNIDKCLENFKLEAANMSEEEISLWLAYMYDEESAIEIFNPDIDKES